MYPLKLIPTFKDYIWGGTRLRDDFGKECAFERVAESWELSCHKDGMSVISNGKYAGRSLAEYIEAEGKRVLGKNCADLEYFPVLIKLIDTKDNLSVQVHPDNEYARANENGYGKSEMWYIIDCDDGAEILCGFRESITRGEFERRVRDGTLLEAAKAVPVKKGDVFFIEAGTLHSIGKGILLAEIQQNSNITYRIYDYGRTGADGRPRPLHIEKASEVIKLRPAEQSPAYEAFIENGAEKRLLAECGYFTSYAVNVAEKAALCADESSFSSILVIDGCGELLCGDERLSLKKGDCVFLPAGCGEYFLTGRTESILTFVGD